MNADQPYIYDIRLPAALEPGKKYPTLFTLHGKGSNERNMADLTSDLEDEFILVHIRGDLLLGAGFQYYELRGLGNPIRESFDRAVAQLTEFILNATNDHPIDPSRRYLLGFSQGAILSMTLALTMGEQLKGIVALNGYIPEFVKTEYALRPTDGVSMFVSHGQFDSVFPVRIGYENEAYLQRKTRNLTFKIYPTDHGVSPGNQSDYADWLRRDACANEA
ncbi:esterase [Cohnella endophytica]|uniref:Esterase n=1 Tax=Cohnella endophytica TaxID=2419778 RepID=A0A494XBY2_9BACL|nr:esterase [Cohnella endophytica]RKP48028.1 esterase [Cohnella endophytica]